ncbi:unnamed protein product [Arabis nemorensis]|uniref:Uncharacterized protein n=1 Tax=Arabis nemorensis TaxID=586526 RepID=A0A565BC37_9BRAS|nr:unnamed protein product [Arabis nemorensis]
MISPLKDILVAAQPRKYNGPRGEPRNTPKGPRRIEQRISKALGVRKKIQQSPFWGSRIHKHASLAREDPPQGCGAWNGVFRPPSLMTYPGDGQRSRKFNEPAVKGKLPAAA